MEQVICWIVLAFCSFCLWLLLRHDWLRWTRPKCEAQAEVIGQKSGWAEGARTHAAIMRFNAEGRDHEVADQLYGSRPALRVGVQVRVTWPQGRPDLARIPRPWLWAGVYAFLLYVTAIVAGKLGGFIA